MKTKVFTGLKGRLYLLIHDLNFKYIKLGHNRTFIERDNIELWRTKYIEAVRKYWSHE